MADLSRHPVLTKEAQLRHCQRIHKWIDWEGGRDKAPEKVQRAGRRSLDRMIETNLRLVISIAKKYQHRGVPLEDLIQEGNMGLVRGLELYDPTRGYATSTYCYWWIRQSITRAIHGQARTIRIPIHSHELLTKIHRYRSNYRGVNGVWPSMKEVGEHLDITPERVEQILQLQLTTECASLDAPCPGSDNSLAEVIADCTPSTAFDPERFLQENSQDDSIQAAIDKLSDQEQHVIRSLYHGDSTQTKLSEEFGVSRSRIGQVHHIALRKLRAHLRNPEDLANLPTVHDIRHRIRRRRRELTAS